MRVTEAHARTWATGGRRVRNELRLTNIDIVLLRLAVLFGFVLVWWLSTLWVSRSFLPTPWATAQAAAEMVSDGSIFAATGQSIAVYFTGYLLAAAFAIPFGLLMGGIRVFGVTMEVYVNALMATPRVAFIPLIIIFLGLGFQAKVTVVFLGAVMPIIINTYAGVLNSDGELVEMARSTGASDLEIFRKVMLPGALSHIVAGLRIGAAIALINTVVAELYTAVRGLGGLLSVYGNTFQMDAYFVVIFVLAGIGVMVTQSLKLIEMKMARWQY